MKKVIALILIAATLILCLTSCNKDIWDTNYKFEEASVYLDGTWQRIKVAQWCDYDSDQIQITTPNGAVYVFHSSNCTLIHKP